MSFEIITEIIEGIVWLWEHFVKNRTLKIILALILFLCALTLLLYSLFN